MASKPKAQAKPAPQTEGADAQDLMIQTLTEKMKAGLTKEQALHVLAAQAAHDKSLKSNNPADA